MVKFIGKRLAYAVLTLFLITTATFFLVAGAPGDPIAAKVGQMPEQAQQIMKSRGKAFKVDKERQSNKYLSSTLIKCKECGWSFRRTVRTYKNTYVRWVCSGHNGRGADNCPNAVTVDEEELIEVLQEYFAELLKAKKNVIRYVVGEFQRVYKAND